MVALMTDVGFTVPRAGKEYLAVQDPDTGERSCLNPAQVLSIEPADRSMCVAGRSSKVSRATKAEKSSIQLDCRAPGSVFHTCLDPFSRRSLGAVFPIAPAPRLGILILNSL
jgi:hypothetical protein